MKTGFKLDSLYGLTEQEKERLADVVTPVYYVRGETVMAINQFNDFICFVGKGFLRSYTITEDGYNKTAWFTLEGEMIIDYSSYKLEKRSSTGVEAATDVEAYIISKSKFTEWCLKSIENAVIGRKLFEGHSTIYGIVLAEYYECETSEQRYLMMMRKYPEILSQIPLGQLASYLCITPQSLSRIRRQIR